MLLVASVGVNAAAATVAEAAAEPAAAKAVVAIELAAKKAAAAAVAAAAWTCSQGHSLAGMWVLMWRQRNQLEQIEQQWQEQIGTAYGEELLLAGALVEPGGAPGNVIEEVGGGVHKRLVYAVAVLALVRCRHPAQPTGTFFAAQD